MVKYEELLDFRNQNIVDEVYRRVKIEEDNLELEEAYQKISERNQTKLQSTQLMYNNIMTKVSGVLSIIGMILFSILFIVCGSFILSFFGLILNYMFVDTFQGIFQWMYEWGMSVYDVLFASTAGLSAAQIIADDAYMYNAFYILGLTTCLVIIFTGLFVGSFFKKNKEKKQVKDLSIDAAHHYLQTNEDDDWHFIRSHFIKRVTKRRKKDFFEHYYNSYITLFYHFQDVEGTIKDIERKEQFKLIFFTIVNSIKNILGAWVYPLYISLALLIAYYQNFYSHGYFEPFMLVLPFGKNILRLLNTCYDIVTNFKMFAVFQRFDLEVAKILSFCICLSVIMYIYSLVKTRIPECIRQYHRRLNYYLKKKQGIYDQSKKYSKCYVYSVHFFFFVILSCFLTFMYCNNPHYLIAAFVGSERQVEVQANMSTRDMIYEHMSEYALEHNSQIKADAGLFSAQYIFEDKLYEKETKNTYLKIYTFYTDDEAQKAISELKILENKKTKTFKKSKAQYYYSEDGFVLRDGSVVVVMKNNEELNDSLFESLQVKKEKLSETDIKKMIQVMGYDI